MLPALAGTTTIPTSGSRANLASLPHTHTRTLTWLAPKFELEKKFRVACCKVGSAKCPKFFKFYKQNICAQFSFYFRILPPLPSPPPPSACLPAPPLGEGMFFISFGLACVHEMRAAGCPKSVAKFVLLLPGLFCVFLHPFFVGGGDFCLLFSIYATAASLDCQLWEGGRCVGVSR